MAEIHYKNGTSWTKITYADVGAAASVHKHAASDITSGTLSVPTTGNAGSATKLQTARKIGFATFDGTADIALSPGIMPGVSLPTSGTANANKWIKFATITLPSAYSQGSGTWVFNPMENITVGGVLKWFMRNGNTNASTSIKLTWLTADNSGYAGNVAAVKTANGVFDFYYKNNAQWDTMRIIDICPQGITPTYAAGSWVADLPSAAAATSSFNEKHQRANLGALAVVPPDVEANPSILEDGIAALYKLRLRRDTDTDPGDSITVSRCQLMNEGKRIDFTNPKIPGSISNGTAIALSTPLWRNDITASSANWNTIPQGIYQVASSAAFSATLNQPVGAYQYGTLICYDNGGTQNASGGNVAQLYIAHQDGQLWFRDRFSASNAFCAWKKVSVDGHTHNYAASSTPGGSATSAVKLDTATAGSATHPVYFSGGKPVATAHTLGASVPSGAVFTDTKNTAGTTNTNSKLFLAGATSQAANPQTYSNTNVYTLNGTTSSLGQGRDYYIAYPGGGQFSTSTASFTGYCKIILPVSWTSTMLSFTVTIYNYVTGTSVDYKVSGYNYGEKKWVNCTAICIGKSDGALSNLPVLFGHDGSKCVIAIGNATTSWSYPQVTIHDVLVCYSNGAFDNWNDGWSIAFNATALTTVSATISNTHVGYGAAAGKLATARTINGTNFDGTGNITTSNWGTARTITIGSTGKSVNGSGNVSWTLSEIGAAASSHSHSVYYDSSIARTANTVLAAPNGSNGGATFRKLVAADIPALNYAATSHTHSYLPLSGGTLTGNVSIAHASTPTLTIKNTNSQDVAIILDRTSNASWKLLNQNGRLYYQTDWVNGAKGTFHTVITTEYQTGNTTFAGTVTAASFTGSLSGNASTASKLATARTISLTGSVTGSGSFDGSGNLSISTTTNHTHSYLPLSGGTCTGSVTASSFFSSNGMIIKSSNINLNNAAPSANQYSSDFGFQDSTGFLYAYQEGIRSTGDVLYHCMHVRRPVNGSNRYCSIQLMIGPTGNASYSVTSPSAFRSAIGITSGTGNPPASGSAGSIYIKYA